MNNLGNLPTKVITEIVHGVNSTDLYACALVNRQFHAVVNPMLWCTITIKNEASFAKLMTDLLESDPPMGEHVRSLHLDNFVTDNELLALMKHVPNLENLTMEMAGELTDISLQHLPSSCPKLKKLELYDVQAITQPFVLALAQHYSQLSELVLTPEEGLPRDALWAFTACPLEELLIDLDPELGGDDDANNNNMDDEGAILDDLAGFQHLRYLKIDCSPTHFTHQVIASLTLHPDWMPHLTDFSIDGCWYLTEQQAAAFMETRSTLYGLALVQNELLTDNYLEAIAASLPNIGYVGLDIGAGFTSCGIRKLIVNCRLLVWIGLHACDIPAADFPEVAPSCLGDRGFLHHLDEYAIQTIRAEWQANEDEETGGI